MSGSQELIKIAGQSRNKYYSQSAKRLIRNIVRSPAISNIVRQSKNQSETYIIPY